MSNYRIIKCIRGGQKNPKILANGDKYDSTLATWQFVGLNEKIEQINYLPFVNTDYSEKYTGKGGILAEGVYGWICTTSKKLGKSLCLFDMQYFNLIEKYEDVTEKMKELPSLVPDSFNNNKTIITDVWIHIGGFNNDYSMGCQTIWPPDFKNFIDFFYLNEKGMYELTRSKNWKAPDFYQGK